MEYCPILIKFYIQLHYLGIIFLHVVQTYYFETIFEKLLSLSKFFLAKYLTVRASMFTFLKHHGLALLWMKTKGNLQVPLTLAQAISVTLSLVGF